MGQRRLKQVEVRVSGGVGRGGGCFVVYRSLRVIFKLFVRKVFFKYGLLFVLGNYILFFFSDFRIQSYSLGFLVFILVIIGSVSRVSYRKIFFRFSQRGRVQIEGIVFLEVFYFLGGGQFREGWQRGFIQVLEGRVGYLGGLGGCRVWLRVRQVVEGEVLFEFRIVIGVFCVQVVSFYFFGMSLLSS